MMRALVTGLSGCTGKYLQAELEANGYEVYGLQKPALTHHIDIRNAEAVQAVLEEVRPDVVFHLASQTLASLSWKAPRETMDVNGLGTINLLEATRKTVPYARVLLAGSSDQYGLTGTDGRAISEDYPLSPMTPYAVSKCVQEYMGRIYASTYGMHVCLTRTFSSGGAGQRRGVVLSDFAYGMAMVEAGLADHMTVGNLDSERDFTHVKDIAVAYRLLMEKGVPGEVYNVGSGHLYSIRQVLEEMLRQAKCQVPVVQSGLKKRPKDVRGAPCNHDKLTRCTGWEPRLSFAQMIADELDDWREQVRDYKKVKI